MGHKQQKWQSRWDRVLPASSAPKRRGCSIALCAQGQPGVLSLLSKRGELQFLSNNCLQQSWLSEELLGPTLTPRQMLFQCTWEQHWDPRHSLLLPVAYRVGQQGYGYVCINATCEKYLSINISVIGRTLQRRQKERPLSEGSEPDGPGASHEGTHRRLSSI